MTQISKRLEQIIRKELSNTIIPVKTKEGILVGDVLIVTDGVTKHIYQHAELLYKEIHLNAVAIKIANLLAFRKGILVIDNLYKADQEYGRWFVESQMLRTQHQKALNSQDYNRADILWAKYIESRDRTITTKNHAESLTRL
jgi:hypothetical protein